MAAHAASRLLLIYILLAVLLTTTTTPATGNVCKIYKGSVPKSYSKFRWSIPLFPAGKSATFDVQVGADFTLALTGINNLVLPLEYTKYTVVYGSFGNTKCGIGPQPYLSLYKRGVLDVNRPVALWLSWAHGLIAGGTGKDVGKNTIMSYADPAPSPVNYMLIGGHAQSGSVNITYCYDPRFYDSTSPTNQPRVSIVVTSALDCGRTCEEDPSCVGYTLAREAPLLGNVACSIFYAISGLQFDPHHVMYQTA